MIKLIGWLGVLLILSGCDKGREEQTPLVFYVIGDWGRMGEPGQQVVANQMNEWAKKESPQFIVAVGDNFYDNGIVDTQDPQWQGSFEKVYNGENINSTPWYVVLGNHDYNGNPEAEIEYTRTGSKWHMPSHYYSRVADVQDGSKVRLIFTDTSPFEKSYYDDPVLADKVKAQDTLKQKRWLDSLTALPDVDWKIAFGHHHIYTGGARKNEVTNSVRASLEPVFEKNKLDVYFCGHEHDLQHLKAQNKFTHHFVSGAGSEIRPAGVVDQTIFSASVQGFMSVSVTRDNLTVKVIDYKGTVLNVTEIKK